MVPPARIPPIVPVGAALLLGAACGGPVPGMTTSAAAACAAIAAAVAWRRRPALRLAAAIVAAAAIGALLQAGAWRAAERRREDWGLDSGPPRDEALEGTVEGAPERGLRGTRIVRLRAEGSRGRLPLEVSLEVLGVPDDDAARLDALRHGDRVSVWCRLRPPDDGPGRTRHETLRHLAARALDATGSVKSSRLIAQVAHGRPSLLRALDATRAAARAHLDDRFGSSGADRAILGAMLLGDRADVGEREAALLRDAGLVHLLAISGLHTGIAMLLVVGLLRRTRFGPLGTAATVAAVLPLFALAVGHGASVVRASAMLGVVLAGRAAGRDVEPLAALALAVAGVVAAAPNLAFGIGFQLSVAATAGLLALGERAAPALPGPRGAARALAASLGAYLATAPLLAKTFGRLCPAALVANLTAGAICLLCLATGGAALAFCAVPLVGAWCARAASGSVGLLLATARIAASVPGGHLRVAAPAEPLTLGYVALLLAALHPRAGWPRSGRRALRFAATLTALALHIGSPPIDAVGASVLDVGQGLAVVLQGGGGRCVLVDAGPSHGGRWDAGDRIVVPELLANGCRRLDALALSHDHDDHAGGAAAILRDLDVGAVWIGAGAEHDPLTREIVADAVARGVAVSRLTAGTKLRGAGLAFDVVHPADADVGRPVNDRCLALRATYPGGRSILLPGDLEAAGEATVVKRGITVRSQAMVAAHHGADGSNSRPFVATVRPAIVVVSAGKGNRFGHPGKAALSRCIDAGASIWRTDRDGTVTLRPGPSGWRASAEHDRNRDEGEDEDQGEGGGDDPAPGR
jgi:competence protein ComEC